MNADGYSEVGDRIWWIGPKCTIHSDIVCEVLSDIVLTKQAFIVKHRNVCFREFEVKLALGQQIEARIEKEEKLLAKYRELLASHKKGKIEPKIHTSWEEGNKP